MSDLSDCVESVISTGKIDHNLINSVFGGRNLGMDAFCDALAEKGLSLEYNAWRHRREWYILAKHAGAAFSACLTYRPRAWDVGLCRGHPIEDGVELVAGDLVRYEYLTNWSGGCRKKEIARQKCPARGVTDEFRTDYREVL